MDLNTPLETATLKVPGASLYYELRGTGPVLLMMPGGPATGSAFHSIAGHLAPDYTVVTYHPRGLAHSKLDGPVEDERFVEIYADDLHRLLEAVSKEKSFVFASSVGAIVGLELAARHPEQIHTLVAHEPPRFGPPAPSYLDVHQTYLSEGVAPAMRRFMVGAGLGEPSSEALASMATNPDVDFFLGHYIVGLANHETDLAALKESGCRIVAAVGADSRGEPAHLAGLGLARDLGTEAEVFPGGHGGFMSHPAEFAARLHEVLAGFSR